MPAYRYIRQHIFTPSHRYVLQSMFVFIQSHYGETSADVTNLSVSIHIKSILQSISVYILQSIFLFKKITIRWGSWHVTNLFPYFDSFKTHSSIHLCLVSFMQIWYFFNPYPTFQHNLQSVFVRIESYVAHFFVHISCTQNTLFHACCAFLYNRQSMSLSIQMNHNIVRILVWSGFG